MSVLTNIAAGGVIVPAPAAGMALVFAAIVLRYRAPVAAPEPSAP